MSFLTSSVPSRLASLSAEREYHKYFTLLNQMGREETVHYNIEDLAYAQSQMQKIRAIDKANAIKSGIKNLNWSDLTGPSEGWMDFEIYENPLTYVAMMHPIFTFAHHGRGFDHGNNQILDLPIRGDSLSIPIVSEGGEVYFISIGFHKGDMSVFFTFFPERPESVKNELAELLNKYETR